ncbi:MAG: DUF1385 domain-containing protein [Butyrivibrio sp.]|nr:DUF1385 domain-containing protein [Butyrivibrio sp.]
MKKRRIDHYSGIGGQAVLEGVMMRNKDMYSVAVRKPNGEIDVEIDEFHGVAYGSKLLNIPFVRGIFVFIDSLMLGLKAINHSSSFYEEDASKKPSKFDEELDKVSSGHEGKVLMFFTTLASFGFAIALFMVLPYVLSEIAGKYIRNESLIAIAEGALRIVIFIIYVLMISRMEDIKRLFRYHGAEHKCINCIEGGRPLTVKNVRNSSRLHKRCGSSFILFVMFVSIVVFFFVRVDSILAKIVIRILLLPVISGISYEIIRIAGKSDFFLITIISAPGLWLQRLTTKEPDDQMIEVAIKSVEAVFDWKRFFMDSFGYNMEDESSNRIVERRKTARTEQDDEYESYEDQRYSEDTYADDGYADDRYDDRYADGRYADDRYDDEPYPDDADLNYDAEDADWDDEYVEPEDPDWEFIEPEDPDYDGIDVEDTEFDGLNPEDVDWDSAEAGNAEYDGIDEEDTEFDGVGYEDADYDGMDADDWGDVEAERPRYEDEPVRSRRGVEPRRPRWDDEDPDWDDDEEDAHWEEDDVDDSEWEKLLK